MILGGIPENHLLVERLDVFYKQRAYKFYPAWCFAVPTFILRIPYSVLEATLWGSLVYWLVGFDFSIR